MKTILASIPASLATLALLSGCAGPEGNPALQETIEAASPQEVQALVQAETERLDISALSFTILDGEAPPASTYFGKAQGNGLMQVASLSKTVAAAVLVTLADHRSVGLDDDIRPQITSLDIASLEGGDRPVTLRQLLSHTTGSSQYGYPGYPRGSDLPSTRDVIANPPRVFESALAFDGTPGEFGYSGGGYMIAQLWAEDITGQEFDVLAKELILEPLRMTQSTFAHPIDRADITPLIVIGGYEGADPSNGVLTALEDSWHDYPELAAAGLWTTSEDFARFAAALMDAASGADNAIPSAMAREMITPQVEREDGRAYGLGANLILKENGEVRYVSHAGYNTGYRALYAARPQSANQSRRVVVSIGNTPASADLNEAIVFALADQ
ncbi:MAG: serine hydrolase domain-containing protein [Pseudomonadota bacterium]